MSKYNALWEYIEKIVAKTQDIHPKYCVKVIAV